MAWGLPRALSQLCRSTASRAAIHGLKTHRLAAPSKLLEKPQVRAMSGNKALMKAPPMVYIRCLPLCDLHEKLSCFNFDEFLLRRRLNKKKIFCVAVHILGHRPPLLHCAASQRGLHRFHNRDSPRWHTQICGGCCGLGQSRSRCTGVAKSCTGSFRSCVDAGGRILVRKASYDSNISRRIVNAPCVSLTLRLQR